MATIERLLARMRRDHPHVGVAFTPVAMQKWWVELYNDDPDADALAAITDSSAAAAFERALDRLDIDNARAGETPLWEGDL